MKKFIALICIVLVIGLAFSLVGCKDKPQESEKKDCISYIQTTFFKGNNQNFEVKICQGVSELLFVADGKTNEKKPFSRITLTPNSVDLFENEYTFQVIGDKGEVSGSFNKESFGAYYMADISLETIGTPQHVVISYQNNKKEIELTNMLSGCISALDALNKAQEALNENLEKDNKDREIYIRMINNQSNPQSTYYWYVAFIANPQDYYAVLVNPTDGTIINKTA